MNFFLSLIEKKMGFKFFFGKKKFGPNKIYNEFIN
jgi:hypothetical protein